MDERLTYKVAWPSGLEVGTAELRVRPSDRGWQFDMTLRASLPDFEVDDTFVSRTNADLCSVEFRKHVRHGKKRADEMLRFGERAVERANLDPIRRERPGVTGASACAKDALASLYFVRRDLAAGRIPPPEDVFFGARYRLRLEYKRTHWLPWGDERRHADEIEVDVRGPSSRHRFQAFFGQDEARTPLLVQVEFEDRVFSMRLVE